MPSSDVEMAAPPSHSPSPDLNLSPPPDDDGSSPAHAHHRSPSHPISIASNTNGVTIPVVHVVHSPSPPPDLHDAALNGGHLAPPSSASSTSSSLTTPAAPATTGTATKPASSSAKPPSAAAAAGPSNTQPPPATKPRSSKPAKHARSPSPSPPPPPPPVPLQTIRLDIPLRGPNDYEVDISREAKATGQRPPTPPPLVKKVNDSSDSEEEEEAAAKNKDDQVKPKKRRKKNATSEYYDTSDPFIDDSELALDERQFFAQTKQSGFYVSSGEVALMKDKTPKAKPKSKKITIAAGLHPSLTDRKASGTPGLGTKDDPIPVDGEDPSKRLADTASLGNGILKPDLSYAPGADPAHAGQKRKRTSTMVLENGKRKKVVDESLFHPDLQKGFKELKELIAKESWEQKGKFPPSLKPPLAKLAVLAIRLDEYDDDFFSLMPTMFPYNKFTMSKLIKRTVFPDHMALLTERQDVLLKQLAELAKEGFAKAEEEWEKSVVAWDKRQEKIRNGGGGAGGGAGAAGAGGDQGNDGHTNASGSAGPTRHPTEEMEVDGQPSLPPSAVPTPSAGAGGGTGGEGAEGKEGKENHPPAKRYRMTEQMKAIMWELVLLSNECCRLENEKNSLEGSVIQISDQGLRKVLYQKIVAAYPEGWMTSGQISRDVSAMKKKLEKEAEAGDDD